MRANCLAISQFPGIWQTMKSRKKSAPAAADTPAQTAARNVMRFLVACQGGVLELLEAIPVADLIPVMNASDSNGFGGLTVAAQVLLFKNQIGEFGGGISLIFLFGAERSFRGGQVSSQSQSRDRTENQGQSECQSQPVPPSCPIMSNLARLCLVCWFQFSTSVLVGASL